MEKTINEKNLEKQISRALEVLNILGGKLPENYEIKKGHHTLSGKTDEESENYIDFDDDSITIKLDNNGYHYSWKRVIEENETIREVLDINYGRFTANYFESQNETITSSFYLSKHSCGKIKIFSNIDSVWYDIAEEKTVSIDDYYDLFVTYMSFDLEFSIKEFGHDQTATITIIKTFETPIKQLVSDLKNNKQNNRSQNEYNATIQTSEDQSDNSMAEPEGFQKSIK